MENSPELNDLWLSDGRNFFCLTRAQKKRNSVCKSRRGIPYDFAFQNQDRDEPGCQDG